MNGQQVMTLRNKAVGQPDGRRVQSAYQAAFVQAYERYYTKVFAYVYSRVSNAEAAKDLTAEVFEKGNWTAFYSPAIVDLLFKKKLLP